MRLLRCIRRSYESFLKPLRTPLCQDGDHQGKAFLWHADSVSRKQYVWLDIFGRIRAADSLVVVRKCTPSQRSYSAERETCAAPETLKQYRLYLYQRGKMTEAPPKKHQEVRHHVARTSQQEGEAEPRSQ